MILVETAKQLSRFLKKTTTTTNFPAIDRLEKEEEGIIITWFEGIESIHKINGMEVSAAKRQALELCRKKYGMNIVEAAFSIRVSAYRLIE